MFTRVSERGPVRCRPDPYQAQSRPRPGPSGRPTVGGWGGAWSGSFCLSGSWRKAPVAPEHAGTGSGGVRSRRGTLERRFVRHFVRHFLQSGPVEARRAEVWVGAPAAARYALRLRLASPAMIWQTVGVARLSCRCCAPPAGRTGSESHSTRRPICRKAALERTYGNLLGSVGGVLTRHPVGFFSPASGLWAAIPQQWISFGRFR